MVDVLVFSSTILPIFALWYWPIKPGNMMQKNNTFKTTVTASMLALVTLILGWSQGSRSQLFILFFDADAPFSKHMLIIYNLHVSKQFKIKADVSKDKAYLEYV